jgi:DNA repair protein RadC
VKLKETAKAVTVKDLPADERPRELLLAKGPASLSNAALLAILLRTGTSRESVIRLAEQLLAKHGGLAGLGRLAPEEMSRLKGIGPAKAVTVAAAVELGKRLAALAGSERPVIRSPRDAADLVLPRLRFEKKELFVVLLLSTKNHVLAMPTLAVGTLSASVVDPRDLFREAINHNAASVVLVHNHPSGDPAPSDEDIALTRKMIEAGKLLDISVLDHLIIGDGKYVSLKEKGIL